VFCSSILLTVFNSVSFASLFIGYMCSLLVGN
jgi:hypothetical protein